MNDLTSVIPDPEVISSRPRKRYNATFKLRILAEADAAVGPGEVAAILRREGLYSSSLADFRQQKNNGKLGTPALKGVRSSGRGQDTTLHQLAQAQREVRRLRRDLARAGLVIDLQKKVAELFGIGLEGSMEDQQSY